MNVGVLGTGVVGRAIAGKVAELGHDVVMGTRDVDAAMTRKEPERDGHSFVEWKDATPKVRLATFAEAAQHGEIIFNATNGSAAMDALHAAGAENLNGKVLIDITNPLDFSAGFPPRMSVPDDDSLAEQIQRTFPDAKVVKTLNTVAAMVMIAPGTLGNGDHTIFVSGDDEDAKQVVTRILTEWFGWSDVFDLGGIETARGPEMYLPLWLRSMMRIGPAFNIKVVR